MKNTVYSYQWRTPGQKKCKRTLVLSMFKHQIWWCFFLIKFVLFLYIFNETDPKKFFNNFYKTILTKNWRKKFVRNWRWKMPSIFQFSETQMKNVSEGIYKTSFERESTAVSYNGTSIKRNFRRKLFASKSCRMFLLW